jgi:hypothetical protein
VIVLRVLGLTEEFEERLLSTVFVLGD